MPRVRTARRAQRVAPGFVFPKQVTAWVKLTDLRETFPLGDNGVLEMEVCGKDVQ